MIVFVNLEVWGAAGLHSMTRNYETKGLESHVFQQYLGRDYKPKFRLKYLLAKILHIQQKHQNNDLGQKPQYQSIHIPVYYDHGFYYF